MFQKINDPKPVIAYSFGEPVGAASPRVGYEAKQSQSLRLLLYETLRERFTRNDNWAFFYLEYSKVLSSLREATP
ncbi:MAG: hypothetical protein V7K61_15420 [Nostoc sp.]